jgi:hypothetical protein
MECDSLPFPIMVKAPDPSSKNLSVKSKSSTLSKAAHSVVSVAKKAARKLHQPVKRLWTLVSPCSSPSLSQSPSHVSVMSSDGTDGDVSAPNLRELTKEEKLGKCCSAVCMPVYLFNKVGLFRDPEGDVALPYLLILQALSFGSV